MNEGRYLIKEAKSRGRLILIRELLRAGRWGHRFFNLRQTRFYFELAGQFFSFLERGWIEKIEIGSIKAEILNQDLNEAPGLIFYLHGGAFVSGSPRTHRHLALRLAKEAETAALVIDYRLAPEFPYPAALEDCLLVYLKLVEKSFQPERIALVGDSAGGGLAVALTQRLIKKGYPKPACLCLFSPWVDLSCSSAAYLERGQRDPMVTRSSALERARWYAGPKELTEPEISPVFGDFAGFPPMVIFVGSEEVLYDEAVSLAEKASQTQVEVTLIEWSGMIHVWPYLFPFLPEGFEACRLAGEYLRFWLKKN